MADIVDELQLKIEAQVRQSKGVKTLAKNLTDLGSSIQRLTGNAAALDQMTTSLMKLSAIKVDSKANGINTMANSLAKLSKATQTYNAKKLDSFAKAASNMTKKLANTSEGVSNTARLLNSVASISKYSDSMDDAAVSLPVLADGIRDFANAVDKIPVSDKAMNLITSTAQLAKSSSGLSSAFRALSSGASSGGRGLQALKVVLTSVAGGVKDLISLVKKLGSGLLSIGKSAVNGAINGIKKLASHLKEAKEQRSGIDRLSFSVKTLLATMIGFRGITGIANWFKEAVSAGADLAETNHIIESTFEDLSDAAQVWANGMIESHGVAAGAAKRYAGTLSGMFQSSGIGYKEAAKMSTDLVELAGDISSFYNIDTETAFKKIQSGLAGMSRPLLSLGIDMRAAAISAWLEAQGIEKSYKNMSTAEQEMVRYKYLLDVTTKQQGDFARTSSSMANSLRTLRAYAAAVSAAVGDGLASALRHVIHLLNFLMKYVLKAAQAFAVFMQTIFGKNISGGAATIDESLLDASDCADDLSDGAEGAADGLSDADDEAKKLKKDLSTLPFDELNQLTENTKKKKSDSDSGDIGNLGSIGDFGEGLLDLGIDALENKMGELEKFFSNWGARIKAAFDARNWVGLGRAIAWGINDGFSKLYDFLDPDSVSAKLNPYIDAFSTTLNSLVDAIDWYTIGGTIGRGITDIVNAVNRLIDPKTGIDWENIGRKFGEGANGLIDNIDWSALGNLFANKMNILWLTARGFVTKFNWKALGKDLAAGAMAFVNQINYDAIIDTFTEGLRGIATTVSTFAKDFDWAGYGKLLAEKANKLTSQLPVSEILQAILDLIGGIGTTLMKLFDPNEGIDFGKFGHKLGTSIKRAIRIKVDPQAIGELLGNIWTAAWNLLISFIGGFDGAAFGDGINTVISSAVNAARKNLGDGTKIGRAIGKFAKDICDLVIYSVGDVSLWYGIGESIGNAIGGLLSTDGLGKKAADAVNAIARGIAALLAGAIDALKNHKDEIITNLRDFFANIDWKAVLVAASPLIVKNLALGFFHLLIASGAETSVFTGLKGLFSKMTDAIGSVFSKDGTVAKVLTTKVSALFKHVGSAGEVVSAGKSIFSSIIEAIGPGAVEGGLIAAVIAATAEVQKLNDAIKGGNGQISEEGGIWDSFIEKLNTINSISSDDKQALFDLKEEFESGNIDEAAFINGAVELLKKMGINGEGAKNILGQIGTEMNITDRQAQLMDATIKTLGQSTADTNTKFAQFGIDGKDGIDKVKQSVGELFTTELASGQYFPEWSGEAQAAFTEAYNSSHDIRTALDSIITKYELSEQDVAKLRQTIDEKFGQPGVFDALVSDTISASTQMTGLETKTNSAAIQVKNIGERSNESTPKVSGLATSVGTAKEAMHNIIGEAETATDRLKTQGTTAKTAAEHTGEYNTVTERTPGLFQTVATLLGGLAATLLSSFGAKSDYQDKSEENVDAYSTGITNETSTATDAAETLANRVLGKFSGRGVLNDYKESGASAARSYASGLSSVKIKLPHVEWTGNYTRMWTGMNSWVDIPNYYVNWYAKGGLFDRPTIAGFGEAGKEAALPLENRKTMGMIADAIIKNSKGGMGFDEQKLSDAVAQGYVKAMMANSGNQTDPIIHVVCKTENDEVLFRAVQRGKDSIEYRNNPTASYGF